MSDPLQLVDQHLASALLPNGNVSNDDIDAWYVSAPALLKENPDPPGWLVDRLVAPGIAFISAEPKSGKTWVTLELAVAIAAGVPAFGRFEVPEPGPVLYVAEEDSAASLVWRIGALCRGHGIEVPAKLMLAVGRHVLLDDPEWQQRLMSAGAELGVRSFIFDPLVRMHNANENYTETMRPVNAFLRRLAYDVAPAIVNHHWTKPSEDNKKGRPGNRLRGTSDFYALVDSALYLSRQKGSTDVVVESEHRAALEEPPWSFALPQEESPEEVSLEWSAGGVEAIQAREKADAVLRAVSEARGEGITARLLRETVGGRADRVDAAARWLADAGRLTRTEERRPDKAGRMRSQIVWRTP